jgi:DNA-binding NtrC family response regulator
MVRAALARGGHNVLVAGDGIEALEQSRNAAGRIDLVVSDSSMPRGGGRELVQALEKERPGTRFLIMSGFSSHEGANVSGYPFLAKPFTVEELMAKVRQVVEGGG